jgi:hypothetical protein
MFVLWRANDAPVWINPSPLSLLFLYEAVLADVTVDTIDAIVDGSV